MKEEFLLGKITLSAFIAMILSLQVAFAHGAEEETSEIFQLSKMQIVIYAFLTVAVLSIAAILLKSKMNDISKKIIFVLIAIVVIAVTVYLVGSTIYTNLKSVTHGPVHWHAEIEFRICNVEYGLPHEEIAADEPLHTHGDGLIHIETTPLSLEDVNLHRFFETIGGEFTKTSISFPSNKGMISAKTGELCNNKIGALKMFVNGKLEPKMDEYVIAPVEAGEKMDKILIVLD
ncbi:MAG: hypothetical protein HY361_00860 [Candidatus Aenigmarchaeota archaeon]|nr:hypothetical protein [Candidatus Aenigmarchaeota archaeon]